jgi:hypothetical protein
VRSSTSRVTYSMEVMAFMATPKSWVISTLCTVVLRTNGDP